MLIYINQPEIKPNLYRSDGDQWTRVHDDKENMIK